MGQKGRGSKSKWAQKTMTSPKKEVHKKIDWHRAYIILSSSDNTSHARGGEGRDCGGEGEEKGRGGKESGGIVYLKFNRRDL